MLETKADKSIPSADADKLIAAHDGDVALLYIYRARTGSLDMERAAHDLCRTMSQIREAAEKLERMALSAGAAAQSVSPQPVAVQSSVPVPPEPEDTRPEYSTEDILRLAKEDDTFCAVLDEAAKVMGRIPGKADILALFDAYDRLGLPAEVILEMLNYLSELFLEKYGPGRRLSAKAVENEAYLWRRLEILTLELAEEYIHRQKERRGCMGRLKVMLGIHDRPLTASEERYLSGWLDLGFREDAIEMALDRTVTNTGSLKWKYMDRILQSWHEKGLHEPREIREKDIKPGKGPRAGGKKPLSQADVSKLIDKI